MRIWIDGGATHPAVKRLQRLAEVIAGEMAVNAPEHMVDWDMFLKANHRTAAQAFLECPSSPSLPPNQQDLMNHGTPPPTIKEGLSTVSTESGHPPSGLKG